MVQQPFPSTLNASMANGRNKVLPSDEGLGVHYRYTFERIESTNFQKIKFYKNQRFLIFNQ